MSSSKENTNAGDGQINKDASDIDSNVARDFHDKDNIIEVQSSNNELIENVFAHDHNQKHAAEKTKDGNMKKGNSSKTLCMLTNEQSLYRENKRKMGLGYTDPCPLGQAIACHPKLYDAEVLGLHYVKPDVYDTEEILNNAEESGVRSVRLWSSRRNSGACGVVLPCVYTLLSKNGREVDDKQ
nr:hypothetical protein [Tanacetum cinerariifolium]